MDLTIVAAEGGNSALIQQESAYIILLAIAAIVAIVVRRIRLPYTVALVIVGLALSFLPVGTFAIDISSDLILALLVPPLIFEAAFHLPWYKLKLNLLPILMTALLGTLIGTFIVAGVVVEVLGIPPAAAVAFGALISATDPVAVIAFFRSLGVDKRLAVLVEGESLFNDGVSIVIFNIAMATGALINNGGYNGFDVVGALEEFAIVAGGGLLIGAVLGGIVSYIVLARLDDHLIETLVTLTLAYGSFVVAEYFGSIFYLGDLHFSGILAVVAASLFVGNVGRINTSPTTKLTLDNFWEFLAFVVNSLVFLIIGLRIDLPVFRAYLLPTLLAVGVVLLSRFVVVYSLTGLHGWLQPKRRIPTPYRHVMVWGGLRGAISLALALAFDATIFGDAVAQQIQVMTFGVVVFTLLVQGLTIEPLIKWLGLARIVPERRDQQRYQGRIFAKFAGRAELDLLHEKGVISQEVYDAIVATYEDEVTDARSDLRDHLRAFPELEQEMVLQARTNLLRAERVAVGDAALRGLINEEVQAELLQEVDNRMAALDVIKANRGL